MATLFSMEREISKSCLSWLRRWIGLLPAEPRDFRFATLTKKTLGSNKNLCMTSSVDLKKILEGYSLTDSTINLKDNPTSLKAKTRTA